MRAVHTFLTNIFEFSIEKRDLIDELEGHLFVYKSSQSVESREKKLFPFFLIFSSKRFYNSDRLYMELPAHFIRLGLVFYLPKYLIIPIKTISRIQ